MFIESSHRTVGIMPENWCAGVPEQAIISPARATLEELSQPWTSENPDQTIILTAGILAVLAVAEGDFRADRELMTSDDVYHKVLVRSGLETRRTGLNLLANEWANGFENRNLAHTRIVTNYSTLPGWMHTDALHSSDAINYSVSNSNGTLRWGQSFWRPDRNIGALQGPLLRVQAKKRHMSKQQPHELTAYDMGTSVHCIDRYDPADVDRVYLADVVTIA